MAETRIVIVEDEAITALDIQGRLKKIGYSVPAITPYGEEAIEIANKLKPNLILMDIFLKGEIDGTIAAYQINNTLHIPIIFMTAFKDEDTFNRAKLSSPYGYITKPFETRDLHIAIELALFKHQMAMKLMSAEQQSRALMTNASCGFIVQNEQGVIIDINKKMESILELQQADVIGKTLKDFVAPEERGYVAVKIQKVLKERVTEFNELHIKTPQNKIKTIECNTTVIETEEETLLLTIMNDITERKQLFSQTLLKDKLATIGTLSAGIIHEINNPMTWILNNLDGIKEKLYQSPNGTTAKRNLELNSMINEAIEGANKIKQIIGDLKGFVRLDHEALIPTDIHQVIHSATNIVRTQFKNIAKIETQFAPDVPLLMSNSNKLQQVIINLIMNATQAFDHQQMNQNLIRIETSMQNNNIHMTVSDTGKGIAPQDLPKIFVPFFTTKPSGTGLGLSICHDIIKSLGGQIDVQSEIGKGTTFSIVLPVQIKVSSTNENVYPQNVSAQKKLKILIVDDDPTSLAIMTRILDKNYEVRSVNSGRDALELMTKEHSFDLILSDLNMPDISGYDLYKFLEKNYPGIEDKMIFITGGPFTESMKEFLMTITNRRLEKPYTAEELIKILS